MLEKISIPLAILAYSLLSTGFVLMKKGIGWIGSGKNRNARFYKNLGVWTAGFILSNSYIIPSTAALKHLDPHVVGAMAGWGVVVLVFLSGFFLGERIYKMDVVFTAVIVLSIAVMNFFEIREQDSFIRILLYGIAALLPVFLFMAALLRLLSQRMRAVLFGLVSGISAGMIVVSMKILVSYFDFQISRYLESPYFYIYLFFSILAFVSLQLAIKMEAMMVVGPVQYSSAIIYPLICSVIVFGSRLHILQIPALAILVLAVSFLLHRKRESRI